MRRRATAVVLAAALAVPASAGRPAPQVAVMTWNVCAGTNADCGLYRADTASVARAVGRYAAGRPIRPDVIFLQEFCTGAERALKASLEELTGRRWSLRSWALLSKDGRPYACHPDRAGRPRGALSIALAVADEDAAFSVHPLTTPPWYVRRAVLCATLPARRVRACGGHLSSGEPYDDGGPGAPYRTKQITELLAHATRPGHWTVFGGDLNVAPPGSDYGSPASRRAVEPAYAAYRECEPPGVAGRTSAARPPRWTYRDPTGRAKLDYLFAPRASTAWCHVPPPTPLSDHRPLYVKVTLPR